MTESNLKRTGKQQYADCIGVSSVTLSRMLNKEFYNELAKIGYKKKQKYLTQAQIELLEKLAININLS